VSSAPEVSAAERCSTELTQPQQNRSAAQHYYFKKLGNGSEACKPAGSHAGN
jgi:hypothetical protein